MAETVKKAPALKVNTEEKQPVTNIQERNTLEDTNPTNGDNVERSEDSAKMILARTGQLPDAVDVLSAELTDQVQAERAAEAASEPLTGSRLDALTLERLDHANTLKQALGMTANTSEEDMQLAKDRNEVLKSQTRDTSKDHIYESIPANWNVTALDDDNITAYNVQTGRTFEGTPADLAKEMTANQKKA